MLCIFVGASLNLVGPLFGILLKPLWVSLWAFLGDLLGCTNLWVSLSGLLVACIMGRSHSRASWVEDPRWSSGAFWVAFFGKLLGASWVRLLWVSTLNLFDCPLVNVTGAPWWPLSLGDLVAQGCSLLGIHSILGAILGWLFCDVTLELLGCFFWISLMPLGLPLCLQLTLRGLLQASLLKTSWEPLGDLRMMV